MLNVVAWRPPSCTLVAAHLEMSARGFSGHENPSSEGQDQCGLNS